MNASSPEPGSKWKFIVRLMEIARTRRRALRADLAEARSRIHASEGWLGVRDDFRNWVIRSRWCPRQTISHAVVTTMALQARSPQRL